MSRPKFLADHDLTEAIALGVIRREPSIEFRRLREVGLANRSDAQVLEYSARSGFLVVSHDVNTMAAHALARIKKSLPMPGVFLEHQSDPIGPTIDDLVLIWAASEAEESAGQVVFLLVR